MQDKLFKILTPSQWKCFSVEKIFLGSELDQQDGFIHLSFSHQWNKVWQKFFDSKECYLLEVDVLALNADLLKIEENYSGGEKYPHYYGSVLLGSIITHKHITQKT